MGIVLEARNIIIVNADNSGLAPIHVLQDTLLLLAREQEWAEAYCADFPLCELGLVYLDFLRREIIHLTGEL